jgi:hypothetical protein
MNTDSQSGATRNTAVGNMWRYACDVRCIGRCSIRPRRGAAVVQERKLGYDIHYKAGPSHSQRHDHRDLQPTAPDCLCSERLWLVPRRRRFAMDSCARESGSPTTYLPLGRLRTIAEASERAPLLAMSQLFIPNSNDPTRMDSFSKSDSSRSRRRYPLP